MKKVMAIMLIVAMLMTAMTIMPVTASEMPVLNVELVKNGGFETLNEAGTKANDWSGFGTKANGSSMTIVKASDGASYVHSGNYAVKYITKTGDNPYLGQYDVPVVGKCKYRVSLWYKGTITGSGFNIKFAESGGTYKEHYSTSFTGTAPTWRKASYEFYVGEGTTTLAVMPRTYTEGTTIYIDDVSVMCIEGPDMFELETDRVFYYEEHKKSDVVLTMDEFYSAEGYTADFKVARNVTKFFEQKNVPFENNKIELDIDISEMDVKKEYALTATIRDPEGSPVETIQKYIYRINRPTNITKDGVYMVDGKPFEPILAYHFDLNDAEDAVRAGVNVIQWAPTDGTSKQKCYEELDALHEKGLKAAVVCYWGMQPAGHPNNQSRIQNFISMVKNHPAVFCYMIMDEPFSHANSFGGIDATEDMLRNSYKIIRFIDDAHPVYVCEDQKKMYPVSSKYIDCMGIDPYPGNGNDFATHVANMTEAAVAGTKGEKPVYAVVQAMSWVDGTPTPAMLKTQLYQAMMGGAQCVGYYPWVPDNPAVDTDLNVGRYWNTMLEFQDIEKPLLYSYFSRNEHERYNKLHSNAYWYESWVADDGIYYALVSRSKTDSVAAISLIGDNGKKLIDNYDIEIISGDKQTVITKNADSFAVQMSGYHAAIYKVVPVENSGEFEGLIKNGGFEQNATNGSTEITGWTNMAEAQASYKNADGDFVAAMAPQAQLRQVVPIASWGKGEKNYGYVLTADLHYNLGGFPGFKVTATFEDGTEAAQVVSVVRSEADFTDEKSQVVATLWQWNKIEYDISWLTQSKASKLTAITIDLLGQGAGCEYDDVVLTQKEASDPNNAVSNGDFEIENTDWSLPAEATIVGASEAYEGSGALKITGEGNAFAVQSVPLIENRTYDLSLYAKGDGTTRAIIKLEFNRKEGGYMSAHENGWNISTEWTQVTDEFTVPEGAGSANFMIRLIGGGTVYYDNASIILRPIEGENDPRLVILEGYDEMTSIDELEGRITARGYNLEAGDRLYLALYKEKDGVERLYKIKTVTTGAINTVSCTFNENTDGVTKVRAYVWTPNIGTKVAKTLE